MDCFTTNAVVYNMAKIQPAIKFIPEWWKDLAPTCGEHLHIKDGTLKKCSGFIDLYKSGFILPMWSDLAIDIGEIGSNSFRYQYSDQESSIEFHNEDQRGQFCIQENYEHLKLMSPWFVKSNQNINWLFTDVVWNSTNLLPYRILTGMVNFKYAEYTHINIIFLRQQKEQQIFISYKTPLVHIIPITEKKINLKHHLVDEQEMSKQLVGRNLKVKFTGRMANLKKQLNCPVKH